MYRRRGRQTEYQASIKRFLELSKDPLKRLKALKHGHEKTPLAEVKEFYTEHHSTIFYVVYSSFCYVETSILERVNRGKGYSEPHLKDLLEVVLPALERVLVTLPELIHKRWQFNSICLIVRKLLHPENAVKLRHYGIKLLILWLQALQESAGDACMELFASAIPHFPPQKTPMGLPVANPTPSPSSLSLCDRYGTYSSTSIGPCDSATPLIPPSKSSSTFSLSSRDVVCGNILHPLYPLSSGLSDHEVTLDLMDYLLGCLTSQVGRLQWEDPSNHLRSFAFLFFLFKLFYLACLYKGFRTDAGLYTQTPAPELNLAAIKKEDMVSGGLRSVLEESGDDPHSKNGTTHPRLKKKRVSPYRMSSVIKLEYDLSNPVYPLVKHLILKYILGWIKPERGDPKADPSPSPSLSQRPSFVPCGAELMRDMWFTSRDNVNLLLEVCRQGFQMSMADPREVETLKKLTELYTTWVQFFEKPVYATPVRSSGESTAQITTTTGWRCHLEALTIPAETPATTSASLILPWEQLSGYEGYTPADVCAGTQSFLRMVIAHTSQVFFSEAEDGLSSQIEICKKVIRMYQDIAQTWILDNFSWGYLLSVLLHLTLELLRGDPPENRDATLGGNLASMLLKTLFVCFLRASMVTKVSPQLWDNLLAVLSSLTQWREVVQQWKITMETMTQILAQTVYNLDLNDLPLNRLQMDDRPRNRPRVRTVTQMEFDGRMSSFSWINMVPTKKGSPVTSKLTNVANANDKVIRGKLRKADTEVRDDSPPERSYYKRMSTPTGAYHPPSSSLNLPEVSKKERSMSSVVPPTKNLQPVIESPPLRSLSSTGTNIDNDEVCIPSPTYSLNVVLPTSPPRYQQLVEEEEEREGQESVIMNPHTRTPSPEPVKAKPQKKKTKEMEVDNREVERKLMEKERKKKMPAMDLVLQNRDYQSPERDIRARKLEFESGGNNASQDLVLKNESSRDSLTSDVENKDTVSDSVESSTEHPPPPDNTDDDNQRLSILYKSSSESDLLSHAVCVSTEQDPSSSLDEATHRSLRRVTSSGSSRKLRLKESPRRSLDVTQDPFSSAIIPQRGVMTTPIHSPVKDVSQPKVPVRVSGLRRTTTIDADDPASPEKGDGSSGGNGDNSKSQQPSRSQQPSKSQQPAKDRTPSPPPPPSSSLFSNRHSSPRRESGITSTALPTQVGWTAVVSASVWQRMLKILGNINEIQRPSIHAEAMAYLQTIWKSLADIEANLGISMDSYSTPPLPEFMPPMFLIAPWVFKACSLSSSYSKGRMLAYQILCDMILKHWHRPPATPLLFHFYQLMHQGLQAVADDSLMHTAVKSGCRIFSYGLVGSSILLSDCIHACTAILGSKKLQAPRAEAMVLLGSMLYLPDLYPSVLLPGVGEGDVVMGTQLKEKLVDTLFHAARKEPTRISRCLALYQVGMLAFSELRKGTPSMRLPEGVDILLASLQFADRGVSMAAIDMLSLLVEVAPQMQQLYPSMPVRVIEALCYAIAVFMTEELDQASWVDKVIVTLVLCLRDWLMVLPVQQMALEGSLSTAQLKSVFEVLQAAAGSPQFVTAKRHAIAQLFTIRTPVSVSLDPLETASSRTPHGLPNQSPSIRKAREEIRLSSELLKAPQHPEQEDRVQIAARSVLTHLLNLLGHFPFGCGAAQMGSVVREYHDCPSLAHLDELSSDIFDSPRVQFFSFNDSAVITFVEIPAKLEGVPGSVMTASYQTRLIVRDVTGKYTWDSAVLYGPEPSQNEYTISLPITEGGDLLMESIGDTLTPPTISDFSAPSSDPLQPPSWRTHVNSDRDILEDVLKHLETTSPECLLHPGRVGLCEPAPVRIEGREGTERRMVAQLDQHQQSEQVYSREAFTLPSMCGEKASAPCHFPSTFAFHHCRVFLSHLGMFAWSKRSHLDLLEKNNQLILELKHLDRLQAQSRQTYKVAVLYVSRGQEDKISILSNSRGSKKFEEFVAGLGWEVNMETHAGYMGGLKREFCAKCTLPYYATSSEEVLFHVSTRMPPKLEQKVRHLGNDEVHIVWSEHWRDYRRTIFKTQFADVLIIIYPLPSKLFRIQINKKTNIPQFGPLFDGALVDKGSLPSLVRATAINALRAQRNPLVGYRGRYEERLRYIQNIVERKMKSSYEDFSLNVMHPLESSAQTQRVTTTCLGAMRESPQKPLTTPSGPIPIMGVHVQPPTSPDPRGTPPENKWSLSPKLGKSSLLKLPSLAKERTSSNWLRPRSRTNDESMQNARTSAAAMVLRRNSSVPDIVKGVETSNDKPSSSSSTPRKGLSPATSKSSLSSKFGFFRTSPIMMHHSSNNTESNSPSQSHTP